MQIGTSSFATSHQQSRLLCRLHQHSNHVTYQAHVRHKQHPAPTILKQQARTATAVAAAPAAGEASTSAATLQQQQLPPGIDPEQLLGNLYRTTNYTQLAAFVQSQEAVFLHTPFCVYGLLHAVQLRDTLAFDKIGEGSLASEEAVIQQFELVEELLDKLCTAALPHVPPLPLTSQATLALALAQLEYYDPPLVNALVEAVKVTLSTPQQQQQQQQQQGDASGSNGGSSGSSGGSNGLAKAAALAELPEGLVSGVLLSMAVACSLIGHYDAELLDSVAQQAVAFQSSFPSPGPLISIAAALLDLQHDHPALLSAAATAAAAAAAEQETALQVEEVISLLLALGFFRVQAPQFVNAALQALGAAGEQLCELNAVQLSRLWKALLLLQDNGVTLPEELVQAVAFAAQQLPDSAEEQQQQQQGSEDPFLLGSCRGELLLLTLQDMAAAGGPQLAEFPPAMRQQWEQAGMLSALTVLQQLQQAGYKLQHGVEVLAEQQQQQQQQQQEEEEGLWQLPAAKVDLSFVLEGGSSEEQRRVAVVLLFDDRYCSEPRNRLRGAAAVDILALQALGVAVLPLPLQEWQALGDNQADQQRYLAARVAAATT